MAAKNGSIPVGPVCATHSWLKASGNLNIFDDSACSQLRMVLYVPVEDGA